MRAKEQLAQRGIEATRREFDDRYELAADFGPSADPSVDVVDGTVIVVYDGTTYDIDVDGSAQAFMKNGILTIEVSEEDHS
jgi:HSP20 family molecular chaperone IbpA